MYGFQFYIVRKVGICSDISGIDIYNNIYISNCSEFGIGIPEVSTDSRIGLCLILFLLSRIAHALNCHYGGGDHIIV